MESAVFMQSCFRPLGLRAAGHFAFTHHTITGVTEFLVNSVCLISRETGMELFTWAEQQIYANDGAATSAEANGKMEGRSNLGWWIAGSRRIAIQPYVNCVSTHKSSTRCYQGRSIVRIV